MLSTPDVQDILYLSACLFFSLGVRSAAERFSDIFPRFPTVLLSLHLCHRACTLSTPPAFLPGVVSVSYLFM